MMKPFILCYHRVFDPTHDPQLLCVNTKKFRDQIELLQKRFQILHLHELCELIKKGETPENSLAITFDDGYFDNYQYAAPLLDKYKVPALFFISTEHIDSDHEFWWDELERILLLSDELPEEFSFKYKEKNFFWRNEKHKKINKDFSWSVLREDNPTSYHSFYRKSHGFLLNASVSIKEKFLNQLRIWAKTTGTGRKSHRSLNRNEIKKISENPLFTIGAHSITHPKLSLLSYEEQKTEIIESKKKLEEITSKEVNIFSYPFGNKSDYSKDTISILKENRFICSCANYPDFLSSESDVFQLPRYLVRNVSGEELIGGIS